MVRYQVKLHDDSGNLLHVIREAEISSLQMTVVENDIGELVITMPQEYLLDINLVNVPDRILTLERDIGGGFYTECGAGAERGFFLRDVEYATDANNTNTITLYAYDGNYLLDSRCVAYVADGAYTKRTDEADDMCLLIVRENLGSSATDTARILSRLTVEDGNGDGPSITKSYAKTNVLSTLKSIADESWQKLVYLVFDTVYTSPGRFEFRVYLNQRGANMGSSAIEKRTVRPWPCKVTWSRKDERNYIYAGGKGEGEGRDIQEATNTNWTNDSIWNRREAFVNASNTDDAAAILSAANAELFRNRPRAIMEGELPDVDGQRYGLDYHWGDVVIAQYKTPMHDLVTVDVHIAAVEIMYEAGKETVRVSVRSENQ